MGKCVYCRGEIKDSRALDVCDRCGVGVWGEKMFNAIVQSMEKSRDNGDLFQGSITDSSNVVVVSQSPMKTDSVTKVSIGTKINLVVTQGKK